MKELIERIKREISCFKSEKSKAGASRIDKLSLGGRIAAMEELLVFINEKQDDRLLTPEILMTAGWEKDGNDSFEVIGDINDDYKNYRRISFKKSDDGCKLKTIFRKYANSNEYLLELKGNFKQKEIKIPASRQITVEEFNTLLDICKLQKFQIK